MERMEGRLDKLCRIIGAIFLIYCALNGFSDVMFRAVVPFSRDVYAMVLE